MCARLSLDAIYVHEYLWSREEAKPIQCELSLSILHLYKVSDSSRSHVGIHCLMGTTQNVNSYTQ